GWCGFVKALNCEKSAFADGMSMLRCFSALILFIPVVYHHKIPGVRVAPAIARFWCEGGRLHGNND
ncbi:hypothetical protein, partial [Serratia proteamaculans]|uniref:hypothetical protein n=1 Tax=Serratia proteamaculans TaxID=28151 RepID=UPI001A918900